MPEDCTTTCSEIGRLRLEVTELKVAVRTASQKAARLASKTGERRAKTGRWARRVETLARDLVSLCQQLPQQDDHLEKELCDIIDRARKDLGQCGRLDKSIERRRYG